MEAIPDDFLVADITVAQRRHLMFSTPHQLELLANARHWYVDATFRLVREPVTQLFTINVFIRSDDNVKQVPHVYVIMSGKSRAD